MVRIIFLILISFNLWSDSELIVTKILSLKINSTINPATLNYLSNALKKAREDSYPFILVKLNTPGGLVTTTKNILTLMGESEIPFIVWITPEGGSATSAGAIIASAAHLLVMNNGTNIGAATPVDLGKEIEQSDLKMKAVNDLSALVQSLAETRGRNGALFSEMIRKASSYQSHEAFKQNIVDGLANNTDEIWKLLKTKKIIVKGIEHQYSLAPHIQIDSFEMDLGEKLLDILANPTLAYILFILGALLIYLELQTPGGYIAGGIGVSCLLVAGICFQVLPINLGSLGLIVLAFILFILEIFITSLGLLFISGMVSLLIGSLFLFSSYEGHVQLEKSLIYSVVAAVAFFLLTILYFLKKYKNKNKNGAVHFSLIGSTGFIMARLEAFTYQVKIHGEIWKARANSDTLNPEQKVKVIKQEPNELTLFIEKVDT
ncbi:MAG: NfeD family protein [Bacteriovoracaceae bacterium]